ncbi:MAG: hypothetical protein Roseis2KO_27980 [Roseivirga sp.]
MKQKQHWAKYGLEFLTVLIGILIAFQLNEYATNRKQQKTLQNHFKYITEETQRNDNSLDRAIANSNGSLSVVDTLISLVQNDGNIERINGLAFRALNFEGAYIQKNAYLTLTESGDIRFLNDFELKSKTVLLYEFYEWMASIEQIGFVAMSEDYYPYMKEHFDMVNATVQDRELYFTKKFANALALYRYALIERLKKYKECKEQIRQYLEVLKNHTDNL